MKLGTKDEGTNSYGDIIRIKDYDRPYRHKVLDGPYPHHTVFYQTRVKNEDGEEIDKTSVITVPNYRDSILYPLAQIEKGIAQKKIYDRLGNSAEAVDKAKKVRSRFDPRRTAHCLVLDKADSIPTVRRAEYTWTVRNEVLRLAGEAHSDAQGNKDETKLKYGLMIMLWYEITRIYKNPEKKDSMPINMNTDYRASVIEEMSSRFKGKIPRTYQTAHIDTVGNKLVIKPRGGGQVLEMDVTEFGLFTEDEWNAVISCDLSMEELARPMTNEDALEKLTNEPILLDATNRDGTFLYPEWKEIKKEAEVQNIQFPFLLNSSTASLPPAEVVREAAPKEEEAVIVSEESAAKPTDNIVEDKPKSETGKEPDILDGILGTGNGKEWAV